MLLAACADRPDPTAPDISRAANSAERTAVAPTTRTIRQLALARGFTRLQRPRPVRPALVRLGQALAFDPVLSGPRTVSCSTCHLPEFGTGDGRSLSVGEGGNGAGPSRVHPNGDFIPRNAPALFNLGAMTRLFWDGRVELLEQGQLRTPAGDQITPAMERAFEFGAISALAMFPVTNRAEMRGGAGNELAAIPDADLTEIWAAVMRRLGAIPEYRRMFVDAYPGIAFDDMTFAHASNAIAGFFVDKLTFTNSPWDRFLDGDDNALTPVQLEGASTFLALRCSQCHSGATLSNQEFHNVAVAQFGPGQGNGPSGRDDFGRMNVTGRVDDRYRFRTTTLRNVELTAPYGHNGAIGSLRGFVEHYSESDVKLRGFDQLTLEPGLRGSLLDNAEDILAQRDPLLDGVVLSDQLVDKLMAYMQSLTDESARNLKRLVPVRVPSGLPIDRR